MPKYVVTDHNLYLEKDGKTVNVSKGDEITLDADTASRFVAAGRLVEAKAKPKAKAE